MQRKILAYGVHKPFSNGISSEINLNKLKEAMKSISFQSRSSKVYFYQWTQLFRTQRFAWDLLGDVR